MKTLRLLSILVLVLSFTSGAFAADKLKVGFVDLSRLFDEYHKTKDYDETLEGKTKGFEDERNTRIEKIRESQGKLGLLKEDKKTALEEEIEQMKADLLEFDRQQKADLTKERNEKIREILLEIENIVSAYADKEDFSLILNDRVLIFGDESIDLTETILEKLNVKN